MTADRRIIDAIAARQLSLVTTRQWHASGGTKDSLHWAVRRGHLVRVRRGVYRFGGAAPSREREVLAACLAASADVVASHGTAAELWQLRGAVGVAIELLSTGGGHAELAGVRSHRVDTLPAWQRTELRGVPVTSAARTICDVAPRLPAALLERTVDDAARRRLVTVPEITACADWLLADGRRISPPLLQLLHDLGPGYDAGGSRSELRILRICRAAGLPLPEQQVQLDIGGTLLICDYLWRRELVVVEYDGGSHSVPTARRRDRAKRALYAGAGIVALDFGDTDSDGVIAEDLATTLARRRALADAGLLPGTTARLSPARQVRIRSGQLAHSAS